MAEKHADAYQWHAHAATKTAAEGVIHTAHYAPASAPVHPATQYGTANTAHYAANTAHYEPANAPVHAATQYHGRANTAHYAANTAHYEPANGRRHAAANFIDRPNTIAEAESLKRTQCCMLKIRKYSTIIRQFLYSNGAGDRSREINGGKTRRRLSVTRPHSRQNSRRRSHSYSPLWTRQRTTTCSS